MDGECCYLRDKLCTWGIIVSKSGHDDLCRAIIVSRASNDAIRPSYSLKPKAVNRKLSSSLA